MDTSRTDRSVLASSGTSAAAAAQLVTETAERTLTPARLASMLTAVGGSVRDEDHLVAVLQRTVEIAHEAIHGASSVGVTIDFGGQTYTAVHTDETTLEVDRQQYEAGDGPCLEAAATGGTIRVDVNEAEQRWPEFVRAAETEGIRSFLAASLHTDDLKLGSFNLYGIGDNAFDDLDESILDILTTTVSRALGDFARVKSAQSVADGLREALTHRAPIEQAKGILMALHGIDADSAFSMLSKQSQRENRKLRDIARDFVDNVSTGAGEAV